MLKAKVAQKMAEKLDRDTRSIQDTSSSLSEKQAIYMKLYGASESTIRKNTDHTADAFRYFTQPQAKPIETNPIRGKTMLDQVIDRNKTAAKIAGTQIATRKVTEVLVDKVAVMLPAEALPTLKSPLGALLIANLAGVALAMAENNMEYNTRKAATLVTEAMAVNAMTDVMTAFDLPGLISGILQIPEVKNVIDAEASEGAKMADYPGVS